MGDLFDAWGQHVYWAYNDTGRLEYRLRDVWHLHNEVLPPEQRKPTYMMEYGIRGVPTCGTKPSIVNTYYAGDAACPEIWRTNIGAFQQLWFAIGSAQLGYTGAAKWDAYWGVYDRTMVPPQVYWTVGPASEGLAADAVVPRAVAALPHDRARLAGRPRRAVGRERLGRHDLRHRRALEQGHAGEGARRLHRADQRVDDPRPRHERQGAERPLRRPGTSVQRRRPARERRADARWSGTPPATGRTRTAARSRPTRRASPASRCRCTRPSRSRTCPFPDGVRPRSGRGGGRVPTAVRAGCRAR